MKKIDCCLSFYTEELKVKVVATSGFEITPPGLLSSREWLNRKEDNGLALYVNMEATGTYHKEAAYFLAEMGYRLRVIQPAKGKQYAKSLDEKNKTDKIDAAMLARWAWNGNSRSGTGPMKRSAC